MVLELCTDESGVRDSRATMGNGKGSDSLGCGMHDKSQNPDAEQELARAWKTGPQRGGRKVKEEWTDSGSYGG